MLRTRYRHIVLFFARVTASTIVWELFLPRLGLRGWAERTRSERLTRFAAAFRRLAIRMGGVLIKLGQFLSSRLDVLPTEITSELASLQDAVPAEDFGEIRQLLETELGASIADRFVRFEEVPLAAASLGQVHRAQVGAQGAARGQDPADSAADDAPLQVIVKVQRPDIERVIATDLAAFRTVSRWLERYPPIRRRANVPALLSEFSRILYEEIDYLAEGRNAETFAANFQGRAGIRIPGVVWPLTTRRVLTLEDASGIKITDYGAIERAGIDRADVARRLFDTYLKQTFEDGFFHADPHPGNLFVSPGEGQDEWHLTFVDFGMVGRIPANLHDGMRETLIALATRDAARLVRSFQMLGVLLPNADLALLEKAEERMFEQVWGRNLAEVHEMSHEQMQAVAYEFRELIYAMPFQIPEDLILFGRTIAILSGMCSGLDPRFNPWEPLVPYAQELMSGETGRRTLVKELGRLGEALLKLPGRAGSLLDRLERGELSVRTPELGERFWRLERGIGRLTGAVVLAALAASGTQFYLAGYQGTGGALLAGAGILLLWLIVTRRERR